VKSFSSFCLLPQKTCKYRRSHPINKLYCFLIQNFAGTRMLAKAPQNLGQPLFLFYIEVRSMLSRIMLCLRCIRWVKPASQFLEDSITCKIEAKSLSKFANFCFESTPLYTTNVKEGCPSFNFSPIRNVFESHLQIQMGK
jgi:hypothetical protein